MLTSETGQDDLERDIHEPGEDPRGEEEEEGVVAHDDAKRAALGRLIGRVAAAPGNEAEPDRECDPGEHRAPDEERLPAAEQQEQTAQRRSERHAQVRGDPLGGVGFLVLLLRHEIGNQGLRDRASERADRTGEREVAEADEDVVAEEWEGEHVAGEAALADQDHAPAPEVIGQVPADIAGDPGERRRHEIRDSELAGLRTELVDRPDAHEAPERRAGDRSDERDCEHRPQGSVDFGAPDQARETANDPHEGILELARSLGLACASPRRENP